MFSPISVGAFFYQKILGSPSGIPEIDEDDQEEEDDLDWESADEEIRSDDQISKLPKREVVEEIPISFTSHEPEESTPQVGDLLRALAGNDDATLSGDVNDNISKQPFDQGVKASLPNANQQRNETSVDGELSSNGVITFDSDSDDFDGVGESTHPEEMERMYSSPEPELPFTQSKIESVESANIDGLLESLKNIPKTKPIKTPVSPKEDEKSRRKVTDDEVADALQFLLGRGARVPRTRSAMDLRDERAKQLRGDDKMGSRAFILVMMPDGTSRRVSVDRTRRGSLGNELDSSDDEHLDQTLDDALRNLSPSARRKIPKNDFDGREERPPTPRTSSASSSDDETKYINHEPSDMYSNGDSNSTPKDVNPEVPVPGTLSDHKDQEPDLDMPEGDAIVTSPILPNESAFDFSILEKLVPDGVFDSTTEEPIRKPEIFVPDNVTIDDLVANLPNFDTVETDNDNSYLGDKQQPVVIEDNIEMAAAVVPEEASVDFHIFDKDPTGEALATDVRSARSSSSASSTPSSRSHSSSTTSSSSVDSQVLVGSNEYMKLENILPEAKEVTESLPDISSVDKTRPDGNESSDIDRNVKTMPPENVSDEQDVIPVDDEALNLITVSSKENPKDQSNLDEDTLQDDLNDSRPYDVSDIIDDLSSEGDDWPAPPAPPTDHDWPTPPDSIHQPGIQFSITKHDDGDDEAFPPPPPLSYSPDRRIASFMSPEPPKSPVAKSPSESERPPAIVISTPPEDLNADDHSSSSSSSSSSSDSEDEQFDDEHVPDIERYYDSDLEKYGIKQGTDRSDTPPEDLNADKDHYSSPSSSNAESEQFDEEHVPDIERYYDSDLDKYGIKPSTEGSSESDSEQQPNIDRLSDSGSDKDEDSTGRPISAASQESSVDPVKFSGHGSDSSSDEGSSVDAIPRRQVVSVSVVHTPSATIPEIVNISPDGDHDLQLVKQEHANTDDIEDSIPTSDSAASDSEIKQSSHSSNIEEERTFTMVTFDAQRSEVPVVEFTDLDSIRDRTSSSSDSDDQVVAEQRSSSNLSNDPHGFEMYPEDTKEIVDDLVVPVSYSPVESMPNLTEVERNLRPPGTQSPVTSFDPQPAQDNKQGGKSRPTVEDLTDLLPRFDSASESSFSDSSEPITPVDEMVEEIGSVSPTRTHFDFDILERHSPKDDIRPNMEHIEHMVDFAVQKSEEILVESFMSIFREERVVELLKTNVDDEESPENEKAELEFSPEIEQEPLQQFEQDFSPVVQPKQEPEPSTESLPVVESESSMDAEPESSFKVERTLSEEAEREPSPETVIKERASQSSSEDDRSSSSDSEGEYYINSRDDPSIESRVPDSPSKKRRSVGLEENVTDDDQLPVKKLKPSIEEIQEELPSEPIIIEASISVFREETIIESSPEVEAKPALLKTGDEVEDEWPAPPSPVWPAPPSPVWPAPPPPEDLAGDHWPSQHKDVTPSDILPTESDKDLKSEFPKELPESLSSVIRKDNIPSDEDITASEISNAVTFELRVPSEYRRETKGEVTTFETLPSQSIIHDLEHGETPSTDVMLSEKDKLSSEEPEKIATYDNPSADICKNDLNSKVPGDIKRSELVSDEIENLLSEEPVSDDITASEIRPSESGEEDSDSDTSSVSSSSTEGEYIPEPSPSGADRVFVLTVIPTLQTFQEEDEEDVESPEILDYEGESKNVPFSSEYNPYDQHANSDRYLGPASVSETRPQKDDTKSEETDPSPRSAADSFTSGDDEVRKINENVIPDLDELEPEISISKTEPEESVPFENAELQPGFVPVSPIKDTVKSDVIEPVAKFQPERIEDQTPTISNTFSVDDASIQPHPHDHRDDYEKSASDHKTTSPQSPFKDTYDEQMEQENDDEYENEEGYQRNVDYARRDSEGESGSESSQSGNESPFSPIGARVFILTGLPSYTDSDYPQDFDNDVPDENIQDTETWLDNDGNTNTKLPEKIESIPDLIPLEVTSSNAEETPDFIEEKSAPTENIESAPMAITPDSESALMATTPSSVSEEDILNPYNVGTANEDFHAPDVFKTAEEDISPQVASDAFSSPTTFQADAPQLEHEDVLAPDVYKNVEEDLVPQEASDTFNSPSFKDEAPLEQNDVLAPDVFKTAEEDISPQGALDKFSSPTFEDEAPRLEQEDRLAPDVFKTVDEGISPEVASDTFSSPTFEAEAPQDHYGVSSDYTPDACVSDEPVATEEAFSSEQPMETFNVEESQESDHERAFDMHEPEHTYEDDFVEHSEQEPMTYSEMPPSHSPIQDDWSDPSYYRSQPLPMSEPEGIQPQSHSPIPTSYSPKENDWSTPSSYQSLPTEQSSQSPRHISEQSGRGPSFSHYIPTRTITEPHVDTNAPRTYSPQHDDDDFPDPPIMHATIPNLAPKFASRDNYQLQQQQGDIQFGSDAEVAEFTSMPPKETDIVDVNAPTETDITDPAVPNLAPYMPMSRSPYVSDNVPSSYSIQEPTEIIDPVVSDYHHYDLPPSKEADINDQGVHDYHHYDMPPSRETDINDPGVNINEPDVIPYPLESKSTDLTDPAVPEYPRNRSPFEPVQLHASPARYGKQRAMTPIELETSLVPPDVYTSDAAYDQFQVNYRGHTDDDDDFVVPEMRPDYTDPKRKRSGDKSRRKDHVNVSDMPSYMAPPPPAPNEVAKSKGKKVPPPTPPRIESDPLLQRKHGIPEPHVKEPKRLNTGPDRRYEKPRSTQYHEYDEPPMPFQITSKSTDITDPGIPYDLRPTSMDMSDPRLSYPSQSKPTHSHPTRSKSTNYLPPDMSAAPHHSHSRPRSRDHTDPAVSHPHRSKSTDINKPGLYYPDRLSAPEPPNSRPSKTAPHHLVPKRGPIPDITKPQPSMHKDVELESLKRQLHSLGSRMALTRQELDKMKRNNPANRYARPVDRTAQSRGSSRSSIDLPDTDMPELKFSRKFFASLSDKEFGKMLEEMRLYRLAVRHKGADLKKLSQQCDGIRLRLRQLGEPLDNVPASGSGSMRVGAIETTI